LLVPLALATACSSNGRPAPQDAWAQARTTVKDLMDAIIDPSADAVWGSVGTIIDKTGEHDFAPKTPEEWANVRRGAVRVVEGANLLLMPSRRVAPPGAKSAAPGVELEPGQIEALIRKNRPVFDGFARALQNVGLEALHASEAKDAKSLMDIGDRMDKVCESCHQTFWYPREKPLAGYSSLSGLYQQMASSPFRLAL
jgi:hypothetical protein